MPSRTGFRSPARPARFSASRARPPRARTEHVERRYPLPHGQVETRGPNLTLWVGRERADSLAESGIGREGSQWRARADPPTGRRAHDEEREPLHGSRLEKAGIGQN